MTFSKINIRETTLEDEDQIFALYPIAFSEEDLRNLVYALLREEKGTHSFAAFDDDALVAHALFTACSTIEEANDGVLLAPLGVLPSHKRQGIGADLVNHSLGVLRYLGYNHVFVLGDPTYYHRFGFGTERAVRPPYPIAKEWDEAWQSLNLAETDPMPKGLLHLPQPWLNPTLWTA